MEKNIDELTALEALDTGEYRGVWRWWFLTPSVGKNIGLIKQAEFSTTIGAIRYFAGLIEDTEGQLSEERSIVAALAATEVRGHHRCACLLTH